MCISWVLCRRDQNKKQEELLKKVNEETLRQLTQARGGDGGGAGAGRKVSEVVAYRSVDDMAPSRDLIIQVMLSLDKETGVKYCMCRGGFVSAGYFKLQTTYRWSAKGRLIWGTWDRIYVLVPKAIIVDLGFFAPR